MCVWNNKRVVHRVNKVTGKSELRKSSCGIWYEQVPKETIVTMKKTENYNYKLLEETTFNQNEISYKVQPLRWP